MEKLYVLAGKARSGKDTTALIMERFYKNKKVAKLSYGSWLKNYATMICNWDGKEETKPRSELQRLALATRETNPNYTIRRMEEDINILQKYFDIIVITDARMPEEVSMPKEKFKEAIAIKVVRSNFETSLSKKEQQNPTEIALDNYDGFDYILENDSSLECFDEKVMNLLEKGEI